MSTPRRRRAGGSTTSSNNTNSSSKVAPRRKVGTPGTKGVEFEAAVQANARDPADTFSYEDVSDLKTLPPAARRAELGMASKAVSIAARNGGGKGQEKVGSARKRQGAAQQQQQQEQQQQKQQQQQQKEASTGGKEEGGAAKRRKLRKQQQQAEAAASAAAAAATATTAVAPAPAPAPEATKTAPPTGHGRTRPEQDIATTNSSSKRSSRENGVAGRSAGAELKEADGAGRGEGGEKTTGQALRSGEKRKRTLSPKGQGAAMAMAKGQGKARGVRGGEAARPARKAPRYPEVAMECSGRATNLGEALGEAVFVEMQGLIRKRGHEVACKAAVHACVDVSKEIRRQAAGIGIDLDPQPQLGLKVQELRKMLVEERERQRARIGEEQRLWEAEEQKCLATAEKTRRAKANLEGLDKKMKDGRLRRSGSEELRPLLELMGTGADGGHEEEKGEESSELSEGVGTAKRVSDQLLESTNDMLLNAGAIGRCLQEMGAVVADGQETKDCLVRVFREHTFKNYPNVNDPKAGIAAMLK